MPKAHTSRRANLWLILLRAVRQPALGVVPDYLGLILNARLEIVPGAGHVIATERLKE